MKIGKLQEHILVLMDHLNAEEMTELLDEAGKQGMITKEWADGLDIRCEKHCYIEVEGKKHELSHES